MFKMNLTDKTKVQKGLTVLGWVVIATLIIALVFGIISATSENGEGILGFTSYRYDEEGYTIGSATIRSDRITDIDLDWIAGDVEVVLCQDAFPSITESYDGVIAEKENLRWKLSEDGTTFSVKCRKSTILLSLGSVKEKKLILRIPEKLVGQLETLSISSKSGDMDLSLAKSSGFALSFDGDSDRLVCNRTLTLENGFYVHGDGDIQIMLSNKKGRVNVQILEEE